MSYHFNIPYRNNVKLKQVMERIKEDKKLQTYWKCSNVMAIERMGYTELITPSIVENYGMQNDDAEVVVVLGSIFHDLGMIVQRYDHEKYGAFLALQFLERCLPPTYNDEQIAIMTSEVLHAIVTHRKSRSRMRRKR